MTPPTVSAIADAAITIVPVKAIQTRLERIGIIAGEHRVDSIRRS